MFAALLALQRRIARLLSRLVARRLTVEGVPITPEQRRIVARRLYPEIVTRRQQSYQVAAEQIREFDRNLPVAPIREYPIEAVEAALERAVQPPQPRRPRARVTVAPAEIDPTSRRQSRARVTAATPENRTSPAVVEAVAERVSATLTRHTQAAAREAVIDTADGVGEEIGWARVLTGSENCPFCAMLASRGPVYKSDKSAGWVVGRGDRPRGTRGLGEAYHDNCDCQVVLVRRGQDWSGRADYERYERLWIAASTVAERGDEPRLVFNRAFRRAQKNNPELHEELAQLWESSTAGLSGEDARAAFARAVQQNPPAALVAAQRPRRTSSE